MFDIQTVTIDKPPQPPRRTPLSGRRKALFITFTFVGVAVLCVLMFLGFYTIKAYGHHTKLAQKCRWDGESFVRDDPELGYVPRENSAMHFRLPQTYSVYTDNRGGRAGSAGATAPAKTDVLTIGCSFTWGHGVEDYDTFARVLERRTRLTVYNIGVASYGTPTALIFMNRFRDLRPKVIVYGFIDDHLSRSIRPTAATICPYLRPVPFVDFDEHDAPFVHKPVGDTKLHDQYLREVVFDHPFGWKDIRWAMYTDYLRFGKGQTDPFLGTSDPYVMKKADNYKTRLDRPEIVQKALDYLVAELTTEAKKMNAKLIIAYMPTRLLKPALPYIGKAVEAAQAPDTLFLIDTLPLLRDVANKEGIDTAFIADDSHPAPKGHAAIAEAIEPLVRKLTEEPRTK